MYHLFKNLTSSLRRSVGVCLTGPHQSYGTGNVFLVGSPKTGVSNTVAWLTRGLKRGLTRAPKCSRSVSCVTHKTVRAIKICSVFLWRGNLLLVYLLHSAIVHFGCGSSTGFLRWGVNPNYETIEHTRADVGTFIHLLETIPLCSGCDRLRWYVYRKNGSLPEAANLLCSTRSLNAIAFLGRWFKTECTI